MRSAVSLICVTLLTLGFPALRAVAQDAPPDAEEAPPVPGEPIDPADPDGMDVEPSERAAAEEALEDAIEDDEPIPAEVVAETTPAVAAEEAEAEDEASDVDRFLSGFHFGSYGRVIAASDLEGRTGRQSRIVTFAPRVDEDDTYAEIELRREDRMFGIDTRIVATVAYAGPLFHYDGEFSERLAIRNLYAETTNILLDGLSIWGGSRMVRGDDVYLMNFWPMDNLNMIGGGLRYAFEDDLEFAVQVGMSQPNNPFQRQTDLFPARAGFLPDEVFVLDRPRVVISARATYWPFGRFQLDGMKAVLYGEQHFLAAGERRRPDGTLEGVPEDSGYVLGAQVGGYITSSRAFANLFFRYGRGLGAYDPLGVPFRTGTVVSTGRAEEIRAALSANWEWNESADIGFGLQIGAWWRLFRDADPSVFNRGAVSEGAIALRPMVWLGQFAGVAADLSFQGMQSTALDELTGEAEGGAVYKLGIMPFVSPFGRGTYTRPHIRVAYVLTGRDEGARRLYNAADLRSHQSIEHFLGISVEWWFSSSSYAP